MNLELINQLFFNLDTLNSLVIKNNRYYESGYSQIESYNDPSQKNIYSTVFNHKLIDIIKSDGVINKQYNIHFKDSQNHISIEFFKLPYSQQYIYQQTFINGSSTANDTFVESILKNFNFDNFVTLEVEEVKQRIEYFYKTEIQLEKQAANTLIAKLFNKEQTLFEIKDIEELIYQLDKNTQNVYFKNFHKRNSSSYIEEKIKHNIFENFDITHTKITNVNIDRSAQHTINFKDQNSDLDFSLQFKINFPYSYIDSDYTVSSHVIFEDRIINDQNLIQDIIRHTKIYQYLEKTLEEVNSIRVSLYTPELATKERREQDRQEFRDTVKEMREKFLNKENVDNKYKK